MNGIFVKFAHPDGRYYVVVEDDSRSAWAYFRDSEDESIAKDAFLYSPIEPISRLNKDEISQGIAPVLVKQYASNTAVLEGAKAELFGVEWSGSGESVAILYENKPLAAIYSSDRRGYSKSLSIESGYGNPWSTALYEEHFYVRS